VVQIREDVYGVGVDWQRAAGRADVITVAVVRYTTPRTHWTTWTAADSVTMYY